MTLKPIKFEELTSRREMWDDLLNYELRLNHFSWVNYHLNAMFRTEDSGEIVFWLTYPFSVQSEITIRHTHDFKIVNEYRFDFDSTIFQKYVETILEIELHGMQVSDEDAEMDGDKAVIDLYNEILQSVDLTGVEVLSRPYSYDSKKAWRYDIIAPEDVKTEF